MEQIKNNALVIEGSNKNSENELEQKKDKVSINSNNDKPIMKYINLIKDYFSLISFSILAILLIFDYFIFTEVLNLNQAYFFNNLLGEIAQEQPILLIFVLLPVVFVSSIVIILYKIQFDYLNKFFDNHYKNSYKILNKFNSLSKIFLILIGILIILFGDIAILFIMKNLYNFLEESRFKMTIFPFIFTTYTLYVVYNSILFYSILAMSSKYIIKYKNKSPIYNFLYFFILFKTAIYLFINYIPYLENIEIKNFDIFVLINLIFFSLTITNVIAKKEIGEKPKVKVIKNNLYEFSLKSITKIIYIIIIIFYISFLFYSLNRVYHEPYTTKGFWDKLPNNNLYDSNISILLNPLKISKDNKIEISIQKIKENIIQKFKKNELKNKFRNKSKKDLNIFYLPFKDYRIIFIEDKNENIILTAYALFKDDKLVKILDVGFIDLKPIEEKKG